MVSLRSLLVTTIAALVGAAVADSDSAAAAAAATNGTPTTAMRVVGPVDNCQNANAALTGTLFACPDKATCRYQDGGACSGAFGSWDRARGPCVCTPADADVVVVGRGEPCGGAVADGKFVWCALVGPDEASGSARGGRGACVHGNLEPCAPGKQSLWGACQCHPRPGTGRMWGDNATIIAAGSPCRAALTYKETVCADPTACLDQTGKACARELFLAGLGNCECRAQVE